MDITPFVRLPEYLFVICKECRFAYIAGEIASHLNRHHRSIGTKERTEISRAVREIPNVIHSQAQLRRFVYPPPTTEAIPFIAPPQADRLRCDTCSYIARTAQRIQAHCRERHRWQNDWQRGGNVAKRAKQERRLPWTAGIRCQRFFLSRAGSGWFEVGRGSAEEAASHGEGETLEQRLERIHGAQVARFQARKRGIEGGDDKTEPHAWLHRVGWAEHLKGLDRGRLRDATEPIGEGEAVLQAMWASMERVAERARAAVLKRGGHAALFEINKKDIHVKSDKPFEGRMEDDTWARYKEVHRKLLCFIHRTQEWDDDDRPPYEFTQAQGDLFDAFVDAVEEHMRAEDAGERSEAERQAGEDRADRLGLDAMVAWVDHQYRNTPYESALISGLATLGIREDGGWVGPGEYTPTYSAVIKMARILVVYQSVVEREDEVAGLQTRMSREAADEAATRLFTIVRAKVERFMTVVSEKSEPGVMDWMFDLRTYGMRFAFTTPSPGVVDWVGEQVTYQRMRIGMNALGDMLHELARETRRTLGELLMARDEGFGAVPAIEWGRFEDDHSDETVGYSFLRDDRNGWLARGDGWVRQQIAGRADKRAEWIAERGGGAVPYRAEAVRRYGAAVERFREGMLVLAHMTGGMPARSWEIMGIRHTNTENGGVRNIFVDRGMVCFMTAYHKGYRRTGEVKVIHRYVPREVGELWVWYLWLVLPFWQQVQGMVKGADRPSALLWAEEIVGREGGEAGGDRGEEGRASRDEGVGEGGFEAAFARERKWTPDRMRRVMQQYSGRFLGTRVGLSAWRHIAIAISNRYLNKALQGDTGEEGEFDEDDEGTLDNIWDLQAAHSTHVAGMVYARELQQGVFGTATRRDRFRAVSRAWHRFFGFDAEDRAGGRGVATGKRKREDMLDGVLDGMREEARFRRFARLQQTDIPGQLKSMMGADARFRGAQEQVIRAVVRGESPMVQVAGTGEGKSMSFMLPAFCSPDGVTIVVVPLVALREDLHGRCQRSGIDVHVWQGQGANRAAAIVFVTPESAVTKGFRSFVNRIQGRGQLDRIFVDECHTVLDSERGFRPQMGELGETLQQIGVQVVFLTATLAPADVGEFYSRMRLDGQRVRLFRSRTTRRNIQYRVKTVWTREEEDSEVERVVQAGLERFESGKIIVYGGEIERVERLGAKSLWPVFHSKVDTTEGKGRRLREWVKEGRVMVTTNALGMGIDVADVRMVVHAGAPRRLRDYAQESGRAGRDGEASEAVVVWRKGRDREKGGGGGRAVHGVGKGKAKKDGGERAGWVEAAMEAFTGGRECRRVVMDRVMDGYEERAGCEEGEEACDVCEGREAEMEVELAQEGEALGREVEGFLQARSNAAREVERVSGRARGEGEELARFIRQLDGWAGCCAVCRCSGEVQRHEMSACPKRGSEEWAMIDEGVQVVTREMFGKRKMAKFSGCYYCGLPQAVCERWEEDEEDGGRFREVIGGGCQYGGVLVRMYVGLRAKYGDEATRVVEEMKAREGNVEGESGYGWYGGLIKWGGIQAMRMCRVCVYLGRLEEEEERVDM